MVTKPDRLARSTLNLLTIIKELESKEVALVVLSMGGQQLDTRTPTGKLMLTMLAGVAEFERDMMLERQREGIAKAKADGAYKGRQPTARAKASEVLALAQRGLKREEIAQQTGIGVASVYRILAAEKECPAVANSLDRVPSAAQPTSTIEIEITTRHPG